jgi:hypothetical protein
MLLFQYTQLGCESDNLIKKINNATYSLKPLTAIASEINKCAGVIVDTDKYKNERKYYFGFSVIAGVSRSFFTKNIYEGTFLAPTMGIAFNIKPNKEVKNYYLSFEAVLQSAKGSGDTVLQNIYTKSKSDISLKTLNLNQMLVFYLKGGNGFFIETGVNSRFIVVNTTTKFIKETFTHSQREEYIKGKKGLQIGVNAGVGYDFKKFSVNTRYSFLPQKTINGFNFMQVSGRYNIR